jgi:uncharacterized protein (TIGR02271 family)
MANAPTYDAWRGHTLIDRDGTKVGKVDDIYADDRTGRPEWMTVHTGLFGTRSSFVPIQGTSPRGNDLQAPYTKDQIKGAANVDADGHIDAEEVATLYRHYALELDESSRTGRGGPMAEEAGETGGPDGPDAAMTRSEEELRVGRETVETGKARLHKYVVTEEVQATVPLQHEEVRVEREPVTDADAAMAGPEIAEADYEVTLHEDRPVVSTQAVPKERVRLETETVTDEETVSGTVRKERIEAEGVEGEAFREGLDEGRDELR